MVFLSFGLFKSAPFILHYILKCLLLECSGLLGSVVPCMLYASNVERLGAGPGSFANSCLPYAGLYILGNSILGGNYIAPLYSYPSRTAIRRKFNLEVGLFALFMICNARESFTFHLVTIKGWATWWPGSAYGHLIYKISFIR